MTRVRKKVRPESGRLGDNKSHVPLLYPLLLQLCAAKYQKLLVAAAGKILARQYGEGINSNQERRQGMHRRMRACLTIITYKSKI
jgi:hypothetical protein